MEYIRRSIKAYIVTICLFLLLTLVLAALLRFTSFDESWTTAGLVVVLSAASLFLGIMEGSIIGKRGLLVGVVSTVLFLFIIIMSLYGVFMGSLDADSFHSMYLIPILSGAVGGILGANSRKS